MAWLIVPLALLGLMLLLGLAWARLLLLIRADRRVAESSPPTAVEVGRLDGPRLAMSASAALLGLIAGLGILLDRSIALPLPSEVVSFGAAAVATALAIGPGHARWSRRRRLAAGLAGVVWLGLGIGQLPFAFAVTACACASGGAAYVPPTLLSLDARTWLLVSIAAGPGLLLAASTSAADRLTLSRP